MQLVMTELAAEPGLCCFLGAVPSSMESRALAGDATLHLGWIRRGRSTEESDGFAGGSTARALLHLEVRSGNARGEEAVQLRTEDFSEGHFGQCISRQREGSRGLWGIHMDVDE